MKTLNRKKSEELFNEIKSIQFLVQNLGGCVQNPDFVNEENARDNYEMFYTDYWKLIKRLEKLRQGIYKLHNEIILD